MCNHLEYIAMRRIPFSLLIGIALPWGVGSLALAQAAPVNDESEPKESIAGEAVEAAEVLKGVMILRISERYLEELFARDIDKHTQVYRVVLGTHARGSAHTVGRADVDTKPDKNDAAFYVKLSGTTTSRTTGRNGPAIIHSLSMTRWTSQKMVRFDGKNFKADPATIESTTRITPLGADAVLPGIRGRIVKRVATRRAVEYNSTAERIIDKDTKKQVLSDIDRIVDGRIQKLNDRLGSQTVMAFLLPKLNDMGLKFSTSSNCINIIFAGGESSPLSKVCPTEGLEPSDTELWFQMALIARPEGEMPQIIGEAGTWLAEMLPHVQLPGVDIVGEAGMFPFNVKIVDDWVVIRSDDLPLPTVAAKIDGKPAD
jgi:hypothetical protein